MKNIIGNIDVIEKNDNLIIKSKNSIFFNSFYFQDFYDEKSITSFIKNTERLVRQSKEYNDYLMLIKSNYTVMTYDNILSHIEDTDAKIELHHYPFSLYEIIEIIMNYHFLNNEQFTSFSIAKEVMEEHFHHNIGLVPLSKTNHQLAHSGELFISLKQIFGKWDEFMKKYNNGISQQQKEFIKKIEDLTNSNFATDYKGLFN